MNALSLSIQALALEPPNAVLLRRFPDALRAVHAMGLAALPLRQGRQGRQGLDARDARDAQTPQAQGPQGLAAERLPLVETERSESRCSAEPDWCEEMDRQP